MIESLKQDSITVKYVKENLEKLNIQSLVIAKILPRLRVSKKYLIKGIGKNYNLIKKRRGWKMNFKESLEEFLVSKKIDHSKRSGSYEKDLKVFQKFLESKDVNDKNIKEFMKGIDVDTIAKSINFYIEKNDIKKISTVQRYISAIKEFLLFLFSENIISNDAFLRNLSLPAYKEDSFRSKLNRILVENNKLFNSISYDAFDELQIKDLLAECDLILNNGFKVIQKRKEMNMYISALIIKFIIFTGMPYREIPKLNINIYQEFDRSIKINNIVIEIPEKMIGQINDYIIFRKEKANGEQFFIDSNGVPIPFKTAQVAYWLKVLCGRRDITGLTKYGIKNMIDANINIILIQKFSKVGNDIIQSCLEEYLEENEQILIKDFNAKLKRSKTYNY